MSSLKAERAGFKGNLTKFKSRFDTYDTDAIDRFRYDHNREKITDYWTNLEANHQSILATLTTEAEIQAQIADHDKYQDVYDEIDEVLIDCLRRITIKERVEQRKQQEADIINQANAQASAQANNPTANPTTLPIQKVKLPELKLPKFSGNYEEWLHFRDRFTKAVHTRTDLSGAEKLQYLLASLEGQAASILQSVPIDDGNYIPAWTTLETKYEHKRELIYKLAYKIVDQPEVKVRNSINLQDLLSTTDNTIKAIKSLGQPIDQINVLIIPIVMRKLDPTTRLRFHQTLTDKDLPAWNTVVTFLEKEIVDLASSQEEPTFTQQPGSEGKNEFRRNDSQQQFSKSIPMMKLTCTFCKSDHFNFKCPKLRDTPDSEKKKFVERAKLCTNCLKPGHFWKNCPSSGVCKECKAKHNTILHSSFPKKIEKSTTAMMTSTPQTTIKIKPTALISIENKKGEKIDVRALLDNCSDETYISASLVNGLGLQKQSLQTPIEVEAIQGMGVATVREIVTIVLSSMYYPDIKITIIALVIKSIGGPYPNQRIDPSQWKHIPQRGLADPEYFVPRKVDLLVATDIYYRYIQPGIMRGDENNPVAQESAFGWLVAGGAIEGCKPKTNCFNLTASTLEFDLQRFWEIEENSDREKVFTVEEQECETLFTTTTTRHADGSYQVKMPFKSNALPLGNSKCQALRRFYNTESRLSRNPKLKEEYHRAFSSLIEEGHMEPVPPEEMRLSDTTVYYLPHHAVVKESSSTTKVRTVFDASAKTATGRSLNQNLLVGPVIQESLVQILIRWRYWKVPLSADVKQMYLHIWVHPSNYNFQRVLWRSHPNDPIREYRLRKVTFGTASAPFQAIRTLHQLAEDYKDEFPLASIILRRDFYVDDCLSGADSVEEALELQRQLLGIMEKANLQLRKWISSEPRVVSSLPVELREQTLPLSLDSQDSIKALGLIWNPKADEFRFAVLETKTVKWTKRAILSEIAKVFDPLGFLTHITIRAKIIMQRLWKCNTGWDSLPPKDILQEWSSYQEDMKHIEQIQIPRRATIDEAQSYQLHVYSDASEKAYGAAVYLRTISSSGVQVHLVTSKARVAPLKSLSLPRLELCGAVMAASLLEVVKGSLSITVEVIRGWTDSTIVLGWIKSESHRLKTFERNRVAKIQRRISPDNWFHIPGVMNPADLPSRGVTVSELVSSSLWLNGPTYLRTTALHPLPSQHQHSLNVLEAVEPLSEVPSRVVFTLATANPAHNSSMQNHQNTQFTSERNHQQLKSVPNAVEPLLEVPPGDAYTPATATTLQKLQTVRSRTTTMLTGVSQFSPLTKIFEQYSDWNKLIRHMSWWTRLWRYYIKKEVNNKLRLTQAELRHSKERIVWTVQEESYVKEKATIRQRQPLSKKSPLLSLNPYLDSNDLLRVGGRIRNAQVGLDQKHPLLLPRGHVSDLITRWCHISLLHGGISLTLAQMRRMFWVVRGRSLVRKIIRKCKTCVIQSADPQQQLMSDLPYARVNLTRPFTHTGIDYAGPVVIRDSTGRNPKTHKAYIAVFVCFCTKAIHLELVTSLSTESFLAALKRFVSRSGLPRTIQSDNGSNFIGAKRELTEFMDFVQSEKTRNAIIRSLAEDGLDWILHPPAAPHMGGLWEAAVKSTKHHLQRVVGTTPLTFEEFDTLLKEIEACLNSRPLCPLTNDPEDLEVLTPGHFLIGAPLKAVPENDLTSLKLKTLSRWQRQTQLKQRFWQRWNEEYLQQLQRRTKWKVIKDNIQVGDMVVLREENLPPQKWKQARVIEVHPNPDDKDKIIRTVTVKTADGTYKRPVTKLVLIPTKPESEEKE